jgi:hypothetical protein
MPVSPDLAGRSFPSAAPYVVSRAKIAEFAGAIGAEPAGDEAPVTFPFVLSFACLQRLIADPDTGIELHKVLHRDQSFAQVRPIRVGDELDATLTVDSVKQAAGTDLVAISTRITDAAGEPVCTAYATLVHRG